MNATDRPWPWVDRLASGRLELSFDAPLNTEHRVDWLKVRDWLVQRTGAVFTSAYEYPAFEWYARATISDGSGTAELELWWHDYPDELTLTAQEPTGDTIITQLAGALRAAKPDLGRLGDMDHAAWREWMVSLGSPAY